MTYKQIIIELYPTLLNLYGQNNNINSKILVGIMLNIEQNAINSSIIINNYDKWIFIENSIKTTLIADNIWELIWEPYYKIFSSEITETYFYDNSYDKFSNRMSFIDWDFLLRNDNDASRICEIIDVYFYHNDKKIEFKLFYIYTLGTEEVLQKSNIYTILQDFANIEKLINMKEVIKSKEYNKFEGELTIKYPLKLKHKFYLIMDNVSYFTTVMEADRNEGKWDYFETEIYALKEMNAWREESVVKAESVIKAERVLKIKKNVKHCLNIIIIDEEPNLLKTIKKNKT